MQPLKSPESLHPPTTADIGSVSASVIELAVLVDAIPPEYREDVLLAALWRGTNKMFQESYMVTSLRNQLCDCLLEKTSTLHDLGMLRQLKHSIVEHKVRPFTTANDMEQIVIAIEGLLNCLAEAL